MKFALGLRKKCIVATENAGVDMAYQTHYGFWETSLSSLKTIRDRIRRAIAQPLAGQAAVWYDGIGVDACFVRGEGNCDGIYRRFCL